MRARKPPDAHHEPPHRARCRRRLNTTVASIALSVNKVLTAWCAAFSPQSTTARLLTPLRPPRSYQAVYADAKEEDELVLLTAPLSSTTEIEALYTAGLIDVESALPSALHSLGASAVEIEGALKRRRDADKNKANPEAVMAENQAMLGEYDAQLKAAQTEKTLAEVDKVRADTQKTSAEVGVVDETVKKTAAETKKVQHDAKAPYASAAAAPSAAAAAKGGQKEAKNMEAEKRA